MSRTLKDLLATGAHDAPALGAPGRPVLDYRGLRAVVADTLATLNGLGIGRGDRVAVSASTGGPTRPHARPRIGCGVTRDARSSVVDFLLVAKNDSRPLPGSCAGVPHAEIPSSPRFGAFDDFTFIGRC